MAKLVQQPWTCRYEEQSRLIDMDQFETGRWCLCLKMIIRSLSSILESSWFMIWTLPRCIIVLFCVDFKVDSFDRPPGVNPQGSCSDLEARGAVGAMNLQRSIWSRKNLKLTLIRISHWEDLQRWIAIETLLWRQSCHIPYLPYLSTVWRAYNF